MQISESFSKVLRASLLAIFLIALALVVSDTIVPQQTASAQNGGNVGIQAISVPVFSGATTTRCGGLLPDIGQGSNVLFIAQTAGGGGTATLDLEWSPLNNGTFYPIAQSTYNDSAAATHAISSNGYYPNLRSCLTYTGGTWSAWYLASSGPVSPTAGSLGSNGLSSPPNCDHTTSAVVASTVTGPIGPQPINATNDSVVVCSITATFNGAASAGSLLFEWTGDSSCAAPTTAYGAYTTSSTPQLFPISTQLRSFATSGGIKNYLCLVNMSGASVSLVLNWASIRNL